MCSKKQKWHKHQNCASFAKLQTEIAKKEKRTFFQDKKYDENQNLHFKC